MAKSQNRVEFQIGYSVDKAGLEQMQSMFQQIANKAQEPGKKITDGLKKAGETAATLDKILEKTFNSDLGTLNVTKFNQELAKSNLTLKDVKNNLVAEGNLGATAYNKLTQAILGTNQQLKQSNQLLDNMAKSFKNVLTWGVASSVFNTVTASIQNAYVYAKQLNSSLNDIRIVTDKSAESMEKFAIQANNAAKNLGASTLDYSNAALIYYQQGLSDEEAQARAETTVKAANITGQTGEAVSEQLTAVWNGYKVSAEETELYVDKLAAVAATTAADLEELSVGMSKVASAASTMGVDFDDLNAQMATIVSVTRQAPESVGTALKTIYARLGDLKVDGVDEFGVKLGEVTKNLQIMGIEILDEEGNMRDMTSVMTEVAEKWNTWTEAQKQAAAIAMAGKRQYNNLMALFENWDMYSKALETSADAMGTLQHQQDIYMESTAAKLKTLKATWQDLYDGLADDNEINAGIEALTNIVQVFDNFINSFGGGLKSIAGFGTFVAQIFNKQIAGAINDAVQRQAVFKQNLELAKTKANVIGEGVGELGKNASPIQKGIQAGAAEEMKYAQKIYDLRAGLNQEQYTTLTNYQHEIGELTSIIAKNEAIMENRKASTGLTEQEVKSLQAGISYVDTLNERYENVGNNVNKINSELKEFNSIQKSANKETLMNSFNDEGIKRIKESITALFTSSGEGAFNKSIQDSILQEERFKKVLDDIQAGTFDINTQERDLKDLIEKATAAQEKQNKATGQYVKALQEANEAKEQKNNVKMEADQMLSAAEKASNLTNKIVGLTSTVSTLTMAWSSLNSVVQTWEDEDASFGDKIFQTLTTGAMAIPMLVSSIKQMNDSLGMTSAIQEALNAKELTASGLRKARLAQDAALNAELAKKNALIAQEEASSAAQTALEAIRSPQRRREVKDVTELIAAKQMELATMDEKTAKEQIYLLLLQRNNKATEEEAAAVYAGVLAKKADAAAEVANVAAKAADTAATEALTAAQWSLNAAIAANPFGAFLLIVGAVAAALVGGAAAYDLFTVSAEEAREKLEKDSEILKETSDQVESLNQELETTKDRIEELEKKNGSLSPVEQEELDKLKSQNALLDAQIKAKKELERIENAKVLEDARSAASKNAYAATVGDVSSSTILEANQVEIAGADHRYGIAQTQFNTSDEYKVEVEKVLQKALDDMAPYMKKERVARYTDENGMVHENEVTDVFDWDKIYAEGKDEFIYQAQTAVNYYDELLKDEEWNKRVVQGWNSIGQVSAATLEEMQKNYDSIMEQKLLPKFYDQYTDENGSYDDDNADRETIQYYENAVLDYYKATHAFQGMIQTAADDTFGSTEEIDNVVNNLGNILKEDTHTIDEEALISSLGENGEEKFSRLQQMAQTYQVSMYDLLEGFKEYGIQIAEVIEEEFDTLEAQKAKIEENLNFVNTAIADIGKNGKLSKKELENMSESLEALENEYVELAAIQDRGSTLYYNKLLEIREALEQEQIEVSKQIEHNLIDSIDHYSILMSITTDDSEKELQQTLIDICKADYEVLVNIKADTQDDFDNTVNALDRINDMASKIGENFVVSAADIEELNDVFPGILDNMELVGDGTVKLNEEVVKGAQETAKAEIAADTDVTVQKLQNQISDLEIKRDAAKQAATIAGKLAKQEGSMEENLNALKTELDKLEGENSETLAENEQQDKVDTAQVASQAAFDMDNAYNNAYQNMSKNAVEWAAIAHQSLLYASYEDATPAIDTYSGISTQTTSNVARIQSEKGEIKSSDEVTEELDYAAVEKYYDNLSKAYDETINEYYGKIAELVARGQGAANNMDNLGSGKGKSGGKDKKNKEYNRDEIDYLHKYKKVIESTEIALKRFDKAKENLRGKNYIAVLNQETDLLKKENQQYTELIKATKKVASVEKGSLTKLGATFDENNNISNYAEMQQQFKDSYNAAIKAYNDSAKTEMDEHLLKIAEQTYNENKKLLDSFENHVKEINDYIDKREENRLNRIRKNLEKLETKLQIKYDKQELKRNMRDLQKELDEDIRSSNVNYSAEINYNAKNFKSHKKDVETDQEYIDAIKADITRFQNGKKGKRFETADKAQEALIEAQKQQGEHAKEMKQSYADAWESYLGYIDKAIEKHETLYGEFDRIEDELEHQGQLIELVYGEEAFDLKDNLYENQHKASQNRMASLKSDADTYKQLLDQAFADSGHSLNNMFNWTDDEKKYYEQWREAQAGIREEVEKDIQILKDKYDNAIKSTLSDLEKQLANGNKLEDVESEWERITKQADKYYDDVEKTYEIQTLANKFDKEIASTKDLKAQQKLKKIRDEELKMLREKDKLTEYDIKKADLRYQLELKQMALEDARNNKTSMKLARNEQGNWTYQYVANEDDTKDKQQDYLDTWHDLYELSSDAYAKNLEEMQALDQAYLASLQDLAEKRENNLISDKEYEDRLLKLKQQYYEDYDTLARENTEYRQDLNVHAAGVIITTYDQNEEAYQGMTEAEKGLVDGLKDHDIRAYGEIETAVEQNLDGIGDKAVAVVQEAQPLDSLAQGLIDKWDGDNGESVKKATEAATEALIGADNSYQEGLKEVAKTSETELGEDGIKGNMDALGDSTKQVRKKVENLNEKIKTKVPKMRKRIQNMKTDWDNTKSSIKDNISELEEFIKTLNSIETPKVVEIHTKYTEEHVGDNGNNDSGNSGGGGGGKKKKEDTSNLKGSASSKYEVIDDPNGVAGNKLIRVKQSYINGIKDPEQRKRAETEKDVIIKTGDTKEEIEKSLLKWANSKGYAKFATGGYTGTWGDDEGRLAMLHQKELVLNAEDTENFLSGINMIRDMSSLNGSINNSILKAISNMMLSLSGINTGLLSGGTTENSTNNTFNITAEFPNAENVNEIREAILSLPNLASQYVNKKLL